MIQTTMQSVIDDEFGTFEDEVHEDYYIDEAELARGVVMLSSSRVYSYDTGGGVMFDWVTEPDFDEE